MILLFDVLIISLLISLYGCMEVFCLEVIFLLIVIMYNIKFDFWEFFIEICDVIVRFVFVCMC